MTELTEREAFKPLEASVEKSVESHKTWKDAWLYNGGTVTVLVLTATVSVLSGNQKLLSTSWEWIPSALSAVVGVLVALERSLGFGSRWRFHTELKAGYRTVNDLILFYFVIPKEDEDQRKKVRAEIWQSLNALRNRESALPTSGGSVTG